ncbi:MAG TPA: DUF3347 domain-containing protein [Chitinophagaceae bacterium]|jgi:hypothetical protein
MKKGLAIIGAAIAVIAVYFLLFYKNDEKKGDAAKEQPLAQSKNSESFNKPFNEMLNSYFDLKNALVEWDTAKTSAYANTLARLSQNVPYDELKADTTIIATAKNFSGNVVAEAMGIAGENTIEGKRRSFYTLSENLYNLLRTVRYDQQVIYHDKCPMAFNDSEEAYWISNTKQIINPYLGKKHPHYAGGMIGCGSVEDSIDYRNK